MKSLAPDVPQLDKGLSFSQHIESVNPASLVQSVGPLDVYGTWKIADGSPLPAVIPSLSTCCGTLLRPKAPTAKQMLHLPRSRRQQMEYCWLGTKCDQIKIGSAFALREALCTPTAVVFIGAPVKHLFKVNVEAKDQVTLISEWRRCPRNWSSVSYLKEPNISSPERNVINWGMKWSTKGGAIYPLEAARRRQKPLVRCRVNLCHLQQQLCSPMSSFHCRSLICANLDLPRSCGCLQEVEIEGDGVAALAQRDIPLYIYI